MDVTTEDKKLSDFRPIILDIDKLYIYNILYIQDTQDIYIYTGYIYMQENIYNIYIMSVYVHIILQYR